MHHRFYFINALLTYLPMQILAIQDISDCCPCTYSYWPFLPLHDFFFLTSRCFTPEQCTSDHERDLIIESPLPLGPLEKINVLQNFILEAIVEKIRFDYQMSM